MDGSNRLSSLEPARRLRSISATVIPLAMWAPTKAPALTPT